MSRPSREKVREAMGGEKGDTFLHGYDCGRADDRAEAQRFFRLTLGLEKPTIEEDALWNNPVPLMKG